MMSSVTVMKVIVFVTALCILHIASGLRIGAFNIQSFGTQKANNKTLMKYLAMIASRYDILSVEEIRDKYGQVQPMKKLADAVKSFSKKRYNSITSGLVGIKGRGYEERFGFLYRDTPDIKFIGNRTFEDKGKKRLFVRDPFLVQFRWKEIDMVLASAHIMPNKKQTPYELKNLPLVLKYAKENFDAKNFLILGDLNAGFQYVKDWTNITIKYDPNVHWMINDTVVTNMGKKGEAYDRILLEGEDMFRKFVRGSNGSYNFRRKFDLSSLMAGKISDHFPVECEFN